ncbi:MAG TPA: hypothetical protein VKM55_24980 [Candidatus Lokiarchaeia archaeon]|nr:hypothetical protein [Candidatus Lokiarchaeia archaeon]
MDFQDAPDIVISDKQREADETEVRKFVKRHDRALKRRIHDLKKAGYSDDEIERIFAF